jgi:hypothetical protein
MRKASTRLPEQGTQTPSPAPDLIPAETNKNRGLTLGLVQQMGALQSSTRFRRVAGCLPNESAYDAASDQPTR